MSAFYDIWFSTVKANKPKYNRGINNSWKEKYTGKINSWVSEPKIESSFHFIKEAEARGFKILLLGQLYEDLSIDSLLDRCIDYVITGNGFDDPAGHYIIFLVEEESGQLHVFTNRFGTYQAYYLSEKQSWSVATPYISLAKQALSKELDWEGITGFLSMGYFPNDKTYLKSIKILYPASYYRFDSEKGLVNHIRYWQWSNVEYDNDLESQLELVNDTLSNSINCAVKGKRVALPISGGLDSRTLAGVLTSSSVVDIKSLWGYSYGYSKGSIETRIAKKIAQARAIDFDYLKLPNYLFAKADVIAESVDLFQYIDGTRQACMIEALQERSDIVAGGHWGDVWLDKMGVDEEHQLLPYFQKKIVKNGSDWLVNNICKEYVSNPDDLLNDYFISSISKYNHIKEIDLRLKAYKTDQWSFRWTLPSIRMYQAGAMPVLPFYDKNVVDALLTVPSTMLSGRSFQIEYIKKFYPDLAKIRWQEYGTNLYLYKKINNRNIVYRAVKKAQRVARPGKHIVRNWELFYLNTEGREQLERILLDSELKNLLPNDKIKEFITLFYENPSAGNGYTISMLHTLIQMLNRLM